MTGHGLTETGPRASAAAGARHAAPRARTPQTHAGPRHRGPSSTFRWPARARRAAIVSAATVGLGLVAGPAVAYFTAGGLGAASAGATTLQPVTVSPAVPASSLLPGTTADLALTVYNPNATPVTVTGVSQAGGVSVSGGSGCTSDPSWPGSVGTSGVSALTMSGLNTAVAGGATVTVHLAAASMSATSAAGCQGAAFQIPVAVAVRQ